MAKNRTALITGAARRLGREIALSLASEGWDIALHYNSSVKDALELAALIRRGKRKCHLLRADLNDANEVAHVFPALARLGVVPQCLINSAAAFEKDTLETFTPESWQLHMNINLLAPLLLMRDFAAHYKGAAGNIINITDGLSGWSMSSGFLSYALSKQGLAKTTRMLARDLAPRIRVNAVAPGPTLPGKQDKKDTFAKLKKIIPLKQVSSPLEVCHAIRYILSSPSLTGQTLSLSGGMDVLE
jgi:NAD(P)-dependent dehydrogenase (short-subunit alcohol dehydrogenase family)